MNHRALVQYHCQSQPHTCPWHHHHKLVITSNIPETLRVYRSALLLLFKSFVFNNPNICPFKRRPLAKRFCCVSKVESWLIVREFYYELLIKPEGILEITFLTGWMRTDTVLTEHFFFTPFHVFHILLFSIHVKIYLNLNRGNFQKKLRQACSIIHKQTSFRYLCQSKHVYSSY